MTTIILSLWYLSSAAKLAVIGMLCVRRLGRHYPCLLAFLVLSLCRNVALWFAGEHYAEMWSRGQWISVLMYSAVTLEIHLAYASHFPKSRTVATAIGGAFTALAAGVAMATAGIGVPDSWQAHPAYAAKLERGFALACWLIIIGSSWAWHQFTSASIRANVDRYAALMACFFGCRFAADALLMLGHEAYWWNAAAQVVGIGGPLCCYVALAIVMVPKGEWENGNA